MTYCENSDSLSELEEYDLYSPELSEVINDMVTVMLDPNSECTNVTKLLKGFQDVRHCLNDITLLVGDMTIEAHKVILMASSTYFRGMFTSGMSDAKQDTIRLHDLDGVMVSHIVNFFYSGLIEIHKDLVPDLLMTASFLGVESVYVDCARYMVQNMSNETIPTVYDMGDKIGLKEMKRNALEKLGESIAEVSPTDEFLSYPIDIIQDLVTFEDVVHIKEKELSPPAEQEANFVKAILKYVAHDEENRLSHLPQLMKGLRLPTLISDELNSLKSHELIQKCPKSFSLVEKAINTEAKWNGVVPEKTSYDHKLHWCMPRNNRAYLFGYTPFPHRGVGFITENEFTMRSDSEFVPPTLHVSGMEIYMREWHGYRVWGGYRVTFNNGTSVLHGADDFNYVTHRFTLESHEIITDIGGKSDIVQSPSTKQIYFHTNRGRVFGPFGDVGQEPAVPIDRRSNRYLIGTRSTILKIGGKPVVRSVRLKFAHRNVEWYFDKDTAPNEYGLYESDDDADMGAIYPD